jgi:NADH:ubiquinone oxidoreductase subunit 2 (subunit N)
MSLLVFLLACGAGAVLGLIARPAGSVGKLAAIGGLLVAFVAALLIRSGTNLTVGDMTLVGSAYSGLFLACAAGSGLLICAVALAAGWPDELAPAALIAFAGLAVALTATDSGVALAAGAAATTAGALVILKAAPRDGAPDGRLAEIRTIGLVAAAFMFAGIAITRPPWRDPGDGPVLVLVFLGVALSLAVRSGAVPFHVPAAHLGRTGEAFAPALLLVWIPAGLGLLALSWSATIFGNGSEWLNNAVALVQVIAIATIVLGGLAALVHDELEEVVAYSIVADAGFVLLALAARSDAAAEPARLWLLAFVVAKTSLVAWAAALSRAFGTSNLAGLRGWLRRTPVLGLAVVAVVLATIGWPGGAVYEARSTIIRLALPGTLQLLFPVSIVLSIACAGRLLVLGALQPASDVATARGERPRWRLATAMALAGAAGPAVTVELTAGAIPAEAGTAVAAEVTDAADSAADATAPAPTAAGSRGRGIRAAAVTNPTVAAAVTDKAITATGAASTGEPTAPEPVSTPQPERARAAKQRTPWGRRLAIAWRLNRTLEVSLVVIAGTALAGVIAFGGFGANAAAQSGIPLDKAAHATPTATPVPPSPGPTPTPQPSLAPFPSGSPLPSGSVKPTAAPTPVKTSGPAGGDAG